MAALISFSRATSTLSSNNGLDRKFGSGLDFIGGGGERLLC